MRERTTRASLVDRQHVLAYLYLTMLGQPKLRVLLLEDNPREADLVTHALERVDSRCTMLRVDGRQAFTSALDSFVPDVILSDHSVADFNDFDALRLTQARLPEAPFLLVARTFERSASDCLRAGAADFIPKSDLARLRSAIELALEQRAPLRMLTARQRQVFQLVATGHTTREIALLLNLSTKTVESHRGEVMRRLGLYRLAHLAAYAVRVGLVL
jgi:DNA-binding NarL/FixJ family response regulator